VGAQHCPQSISDAKQHSVTGRVPARIVDRLEAVDIDECQAERLLCPLCFRYLAI
jgi:hypothetical protein